MNTYYKQNHCFQPFWLHSALHIPLKAVQAGRLPPTLAIPSRKSSRMLFVIIPNDCHTKQLLQPFKVCHFNLKRAETRVPYWRRSPNQYPMFTAGRTLSDSCWTYTIAHFVLFVWEDSPFEHPGLISTPLDTEALLYCYWTSTKVNWHLQWNQPATFSTRLDALKLRCENQSIIQLRRRKP